MSDKEPHYCAYCKEKIDDIREAWYSLGQPCCSRRCQKAYATERQDPEQYDDPTVWVEVEAEQAYN